MSRHQLRVPDLGLGDQPIVASVWLVERGSRIAEGDPLLEVLAGSAVVDLPAPADGVLVEKLVDEEETLQQGQPVAIVESDG
ncbi:MAG: biotin/lipoyl-containing protein [Planctomycetota bacterium]|jgi:pyruvate/2-oxoglutarate dehydrogenase complex dihydrolipoamide acyltransferase (E2) component